MKLPAELQDACLDKIKKAMNFYGYQNRDMADEILSDVAYLIIWHERDRITSLESQLADALAANQVMREALQKISDGEYGEQDRNKKCKHDKYHWEDCEQCIHEVVDAALAIKPEDVEISIYGYVSNSTYSVTDAGTVRKTVNDVFKNPVYTIKTKE